MNEQIMNLLKDPTIQTFLFGLIINFFQFLWSMKTAKNQDIRNQLIAHASVESYKLLEQQLDNKEKRDKVVDFIYKQVPDSYRKKIDEKTLIDITETAYQFFVKPIK